MDINYNTQSEDLIRPKEIKNNAGNWQQIYPLEYYVDFETINHNLYCDPNFMNLENNNVDANIDGNIHGNVSFMIGIGFQCNYDIKSNENLR